MSLRDHTRGHLRDALLVAGVVYLAGLGIFDQGVAESLGAALGFLTGYMLIGVVWWAIFVRGKAA